MATGLGPTSIKPVDLLHVRGVEYWEFADPFGFRFDARALLLQEQREAEMIVEAICASVEKGQIPEVSAGWKTADDLADAHEEYEREQRRFERAVRAIQRESSKERKERLWREVVLGEKVSANLSEIFKQDEDTIRTLPEREIPDYERTRDGFPPMPPGTLDIADGLGRRVARDGSPGAWVIDMGSIDGWENFGIYALANNEGGIVFSCDVASTELNRRKL